MVPRYSLWSAVSQIPRTPYGRLQFRRANRAASGDFGNWNLSPDRKYFYFTSEGADPKAQRLRVVDRQIETITSLKDLRRVSDWVENTQINVAPDGSPIFTRDIGSQEIYALTVKWP